MVDRQPRRFMRQGRGDLATEAQVKAYAGPYGEVIATPETLRLQDGVTPGGIPMVTPATAPLLPLPAAGSTQPDRINLLGFANDAVRVRGRFTSGGACNQLGFREALKEAHDGGKKLIVDNDVQPAASLTMSIASDVEIIGERNARIVAQPGFAAGQKLFQLTGGTGCKVRIVGLDIDARNVPNSLPGQANDAFSLNTTLAERLIVEDLSVYCGDSFLTAGADSGVFIAPARFVSVRRLTVQGAPDSGLYLSGGSTGTGTSEFLEEVFLDELKFVRCSGVILKRRFVRVAIGRVIGIDSPNLVVVGGEATNNPANGGIGGVTPGGVIYQADDISIGSITAFRCETACILRFVRNAHVGSIISRSMGTYIAPTGSGGGYVSSLAFGLQLQGTARAKVESIECDGLNGSAAVTRSEAVRVLSRTANAGRAGQPDGTNEETRHSTDNTVEGIKVKGIGRSINEETADQDLNTYAIETVKDMTDVPVLRGPGSTLRRTSNGGVEELAPFIALSPGGSPKLTANTTGLGFHGATPIARPTIAPAATDPASTQALANDLRAKFIAYGILAP